jgi:hypothetical protein
MAILLNTTSKIYLACPSNFATGGTEVIHQLANKLQIMGFSKVFLFYLNPTKDHPVHPQFEKYRTHFVREIEDHQDHVLIVPEIHTSTLYHYQHIRKVIWWLSVDNYLISRKLNSSLFYRLKVLVLKRKLLVPRRLFCFGEKGGEKIFHLYQSEYAREFLEKKDVSKNKAYLSDYLNSTFLGKVVCNEKQDQIVYNPAKGLEFTQQLMAFRPNWKWIPIQHLSPVEVKELLCHSKVYIDFGHHPGKDRLPREAALAGCCLITGKSGAAANSVDIAIPEEYKFDQKQKSLQSIVEKIDHCLKNYEELKGGFEAYRGKIAEEEKEFEICIKQIFRADEILILEDRD